MLVGWHLNFKTSLARNVKRRQLNSIFLLLDPVLQTTIEFSEVFSITNYTHFHYGKHLHMTNIISLAPSIDHLHQVHNICITFPSSVQHDSHPPLTQPLPHQGVRHILRV